MNNINEMVKVVMEINKKITRLTIKYKKLEEENARLKEELKILKGE